jgi:hypothetical protein
MTLFSFLIGCAGLLVGHPFDTIKVSYQANAVNLLLRRNVIHGVNGWQWLGKARVKELLHISIILTNVGLFTISYTLDGFFFDI